MKIGIQTWGSEGDIEPFIALAAGLIKSGHKVTLAITSADRKEYKNISDQLGFKLGTVDYIGRSEEELNALGRKMIETSNPLEQLKIVFKEMFEPRVESMYKTALSLCKENDILIGHFIHYPLQTAAESISKPYLTVTLNHGAISSRFKAPRPFPNLGKWLNLLAWKLSEKMINNAVLHFINDLRKKEGLPDAQSFREVWESPLCNLIAVSPLLCPPAKDWGTNQKVCGFFRMNGTGNERKMPEHLPRFLDNGEPPVYMTFGSMIGTETNTLIINETTRLLFDVAKLAGCRAVIQSQWEKVTGIPEDKNIFRVNSAPHLKVFPRCSAVIHHGGAGTTQTATICGCPSVVIAHILDQFLWGTELKQLGIGGKVLNRRKVSSKRIAREIQAVLQDKSIIEKAKKIGKQLKNEDGVTNAVNIIEHQFAKTIPPVFN